MDLSGNKGLLDRCLVAFFASRTSPPEALDLALRWAHEISQTDKIVVSGFHSPIERAVLDVLLSRGCSVVVALGRSLYRRILDYLCEAYSENRVLFVSIRDLSRQNFSSSQMRNWYVADIAQETVFAPFASASQLSTLYFYLLSGSKKVFLLEE